MVYLTLSYTKRTYIHSRTNIWDGLVVNCAANPPPKFHMKSLFTIVRLAAKYVWHAVEDLSIIALIGKLHPDRQKNFGVRTSVGNFVFTTRRFGFSWTPFFRSLPPPPPSVSPITSIILSSLLLFLSITPCLSPPPPPPRPPPCVYPSSWSLSVPLITQCPPPKARVGKLRM